MLTNKQVWGTNLGQRGQKRDFWVKNDGFPREKTQEQGLCPSVTCWVRSSSPWRLHGVEPRVWVVLSTCGRSKLPKLILLMYLTTVMLSKPIETSNELD